MIPNRSKVAVSCRSWASTSTSGSSRTVHFWPLMKTVVPAGRRAIFHPNGTELTFISWKRFTDHKGSRGKNGSRSWSCETAGSTDGATPGSCVWDQMPEGFKGQRFKRQSGSRSWSCETTGSADAAAPDSCESSKARRCARGKQLKLSSAGSAAGGSKTWQRQGLGLRIL